ncbi:terminase family protein [Altererythrobacter sp. H2]|uniref:DNA-packaging protein n=1 Tax=Altererythrobacter sp. H2 TaxID=3108391 RepID=UPI002B4BEA66|nr:terminase family protein [Altererythrobacter sp. H2]WRK96343.1 terminase family protein [Altererythrobacter sp. H2]
MTRQTANTSPAERREWLANQTEDPWPAVIPAMTGRQRATLPRHWHYQAHEGQLPPPGAWHCWLVMAGRGFGKTRAGAEWVREIARRDRAARIALVGASLGEVRRVMVEGPSGLLAIAAPDQRPRFEPSRGLLRWNNGAEARLYSAAEPDSLRGPQHSHAWCDEVAKWDNSGGRAMAAWDNLELGLRLGPDPRITATTTPRAVALVRRLLARDGVVVSGGKSEANARNLPRAFLDRVRAEYGGTALGRQELDGELLEEIEGALWSRALLEQCRTASGLADRRRTVIGVDPPASASGDACGIVVVALGDDGFAHVLADASVEQASPERWARAVATAAREWQADRVVAEANQGGAMVASVLRAADVSLPLKLVHASKGKVARAEPVAALYEAGRVKHAGTFPKLEDELCGLMAGGGYEGPGRSPDRADALVWALTELMLGQRARPRISAM